MQDMTSTRPIDRSPFDRTIAVWNHKGGTFKTSVVANLGYLFAAGGNKVLLVDMDPQANLDIDFGIPAGERERGMGLAEALREGTALPPPQHLSENLHLVSGGAALNEFTDPASLAAILDRVTTARYDLLAQALAPLAWDYDLIFIDSGPAQTLLSQTILGVARWLVVPTRTDNASITGLVDVQDAIDGVASCNPDLQLLGVVLAGVGARATRIAADKRHAIDTVLGAGTVFDAVIHYSEKVSVLARQQGKTVAELANEYHNTQPAYTYLAKGQNIPNVAKAAVSIETDYLRLATEISDRPDAGHPNYSDPHGDPSSGLCRPLDQRRAPNPYGYRHSGQGQQRGRPVPNPGGLDRQRRTGAGRRTDHHPQPPLPDPVHPPAPRQGHDPAQPGRPNCRDSAAQHQSSRDSDDHLPRPGAPRDRRMVPPLRAPAATPAGRPRR